MVLYSTSVHSCFYKILLKNLFPAASRRPLHQRPRPPVRVISEFDSPDGFRPQANKIIWKLNEGCSRRISFVCYLLYNLIFEIGITNHQGNPYRGVTFETATEQEIVSGPPQGKWKKGTVCNFKWSESEYFGFIGPLTILLIRRRLPGALSETSGRAATEKVWQDHLAKMPGCQDARKPGCQDTNPKGP